MTKYGILHNQHMTFFHKIRNDGTPTKREYRENRWAGWCTANGDALIGFDSEEAAREFAESVFLPKRWKVVEIDEDGNPVLTQEQIDDLKYKQIPEYQYVG